MVFLSAALASARKAIFALAAGCGGGGDGRPPSTVSVASPLTPFVIDGGGGGGMLMATDGSDPLTTTGLFVVEMSNCDGGGGEGNPLIVTAAATDRVGALASNLLLDVEATSTTGRPPGLTIVGGGGFF